MSSGRYVLFRVLFFLVQMPIGVFFPYLFLHLRNSAGFGAREISYVMIIGGVTILLFQQLWGYLGDLVVSKRWLIAVNSMAAGAVFILVGEVRDFRAVLALMFVFYALFTPIAQLLNGFLFTHHGSEHRFGVLRGYSSLGFVFANVGVGVIADKLTGGSLQFIFWLFAVVSLAGGLLVLLFPEPIQLPSERLRFVDVQKFFLRSREVGLFLGIVLLYSSAHSFSYALQSFLMADMGADMRLVSFSYTFGALLELPVFFFAAVPMIRRFGEVRMIMFAALVQGVRWLLVWASTDPVQVILISGLHGVTFAVFYAAAISYMNKHAGPHLKASAQAIFALVYFGFAATVGNYAGGQVASGGALGRLTRAVVVNLLHLPDRGDLHNLYVFSAVLAAAAAAACPILIGWERSLQHGRVLGKRG
jgi:MFS transporter, PPP family, 3-phenylpropionic acid transporter